MERRPTVKQRCWLTLEDSLPAPAITHVTHYPTCYISTLMWQVVARCITYVWGGWKKTTEERHQWRGITMMICWSCISQSCNYTSHAPTPARGVIPSRLKSGIQSCLLQRRGHSKLTMSFTLQKQQMATTFPRKFRLRTRIMSWSYVWIEGVRKNIIL